MNIGANGDTLILLKGDLKMERKVSINRKTNEVNITGSLNIDGTGESKIKTGIDFLDHMLTLFAFFGFFDLEIEAVGDLSHHSNEDVAIALGKAFSQALGEGVGIKRYGFAFCPMDEESAMCIIDISGRPFFELKCDLGGAAETGSLDNYDLNEARHFMKAFTDSAKTTIHINANYRGDLHHLIECVFKSFGIALDMATQIDPRRKAVSSTKGVLDL